MDEDMFFIAWPLLVPIVAIIGGITYSIINSNNRRRIRELEIRERIAMIEKGLVPSPEVNPQGFERAMGAGSSAWWDDERAWRPGRSRRAGVTLIGVGLGLMFMLTMIVEPRIGLGVGGFLVIFGAALFISSIFEGGDRGSAVK